MDNAFKVGDAVRMRVGYDAQGVPEFSSGCIECIRPSTDPAAMGARVAEIDVGRVEPSVAYLHDLARWNAISGCSDRYLANEAFIAMYGPWPKD